MKRVEQLAAGQGCTPAQLALAWLLSLGADIAPIPGTKRRARLEENLGAADISLSAADIATIDEIFPVDAAAGERYPMSAIDR